MTEYLLHYSCTVCNPVEVWIHFKSINPMAVYSNVPQYVFMSTF